MKDTWQRDVPVFNVPIWTRPFKFFCGLAGLGMILVVYREIAGLSTRQRHERRLRVGYLENLQHNGAHGIGIGSIRHRHRRLGISQEDAAHCDATAVLTSFLAYAFGLCMLGVDVGRPWNFYWIMVPWHWNLHSPLLEVAVCMSVYACIPLFLENIPPALDYVYDRFPQSQPTIKQFEKVIVAGFPFVVSLAYVLPAMHQSSLGALMLLGGNRVYPLWQTPFLPLLYVWAAAILGFSFVTATLLSAA